MLVLSRKVGQQILIGDGIAITVVRISPTAVRIGVQAPEGIHIVRGDRPAVRASDAERNVSDLS
jgi:carbon storage regulator